MFLHKKRIVSLVRIYTTKLNYLFFTENDVLKTTLHSTSNQGVTNVKKPNLLKFQAH